MLWGSKWLKSVQPVRPVAPTGQTGLAQADKNNLGLVICCVNFLELMTVTNFILGG